MNSEKRALSWQQFIDSGFDGRDYRFPDRDGSFTGRIACKRWDRKNNILVYLDMDDGRKIITSAWQDKNYLGLADLPVGTKVHVSFVTSENGNAYLKSVETA